MRRMRSITVAPVRRRRRGFPRLRRLRGIALRLALLGAVAAGPAWLWQTGRLVALWQAAGVASGELTAALHLTIAELLVNGRDQTTQPEIQAALGIHRGDAILGVDLEGTKARLEALPWVASAAVERRLPDTIHVQIVERTAVGRWKKGGRVALIDRNGAVFAAANTKDFRHLPMFTGAGAPHNATALVDMMASRPMLAQRVVRAARRGDRRWDLLLKGGIVVRLPEKHPRRAWDRLAFLALEYGLLDRGLAGIDMRLPDRLVLRPPKRAVPTATAPGKST